MKKILQFILLACIVVSCMKNSDGPTPSPIDVNVIEIGDVENVINESSLDLYRVLAFTDPEEKINPSDEDMFENHSFTTSVLFTYSEGTVQCTGVPIGVDVTVSGADVIVNSKVDCISYVLSGTCSDGSFKVYSSNKFKLSLNGLSLTNPTGAAINCQSSKRMFLDVIQGTNNTLSDGVTYLTPDTEDEKGCIFSEGQIIVSGQGNLSIIANGKHGISSDDYVRIRPGNFISITSVGDGIHTNDGIIIGGGKLSIESVRDGMECEVGDILISGGVTDIKTSGQGGEGIKTGGLISISDGAVRANTLGDASKAIKSDYEIFIKGGTILAVCTGNAIVENNDISSPCAIKSDGKLSVSNANVIAYASGTAGKGISSVGDILIDNGTVSVMTKGVDMISGKLDSFAKGIKSDGNITVKSGNLSIQTKGGEGSKGLESDKNIVINGGKVEVASLDDCVKAVGTITISGGSLYAYSDNSDAIDANGNISISNGLIIASGSDTDNSFNCDGQFSITGGTVIGTGNTTATPSSSSQNSILYSTSGKKGELVNISAAGVNGTFAIPRDLSSMKLLFSDSSLKTNQSCDIYIGGTKSGGSSFYTFFKETSYKSGVLVTSFDVQTGVNKIN